MPRALLDVSCLLSKLRSTAHISRVRFCFFCFLSMKADLCHTLKIDALGPRRSKSLVQVRSSLRLTILGIFLYERVHARPSWPWEISANWMISPCSQTEVFYVAARGRQSVFPLLKYHCRLRWSSRRRNFVGDKDRRNRKTKREKKHHEDCRGGFNLLPEHHSYNVLFIVLGVDA